MRWLIYILLTFSVAYGQLEPNVTINQFKGLVTNRSELLLQPGELSIALNGNINRGIWEKRKGYLQLHRS